MKVLILNTLLYEQQDPHPNHLPSSLPEDLPEWAKRALLRSLQMFHNFCSFPPQAAQRLGNWLND
jgi:hypothetical protein